jgi:hypothetical protein
MTETRKLAAIVVADVLANLGRLEEAQSEAKAGLSRFSIRRFRSGARQASAFSTPCARRQCRKDEPGPKARGDSFGVRAGGMGAVTLPCSALGRATD